MPEDLVAALEQVPLLAGIDRRELRMLARSLAIRTFNEGELVTREGGGAVGFFLVLEGNAVVSIGGELVRSLGRGDHFGEVALLDDSVRSASIVAATDLRCAGMAAWQFRPFLEAHPKVAWPLLQTLARRLREAEERVERPLD
jgi:CRP/FNR family cyclic AMP-dependent transcriptional regulator